MELVRHNAGFSSAVERAAAARRAQQAQQQQQPSQLRGGVEEVEPSPDPEIGLLSEALEDLSLP